MIEFCSNKHLLNVIVLQELERLASESEEKKKEKERKDLLKKEEEEMKFKTKIGRSIYHTVQVLKSRHIEKSEMFVPGRMAYVIDLGKFCII